MAGSGFILRSKRVSITVTKQGGGTRSFLLHQSDVPEFLTRIPASSYTIHELYYPADFDAAFKDRNSLYP